MENHEDGRTEGVSGDDHETEAERVYRVELKSYQYEVRVLLRLLLKMGGSFTEEQFDGWFNGYAFKSGRRNFRQIHGDSILLAPFSPWHSWQWWLDLLQHMTAVDMVRTSQEGKPSLISYHITATGSKILRGDSSARSS